MFNFDVITNENNAEHNPKWPYNPDHPDRMLIIGGSGSGKTCALLNLHCVKSDQIPSFFWSLFSSIRTKYGDLFRKSTSSVRIQENTEQKKFCIWTLFTQC